jgi:hypothetical protein
MTLFGAEKVLENTDTSTTFGKGEKKFSRIKGLNQRDG